MPKPTPASREEIKAVVTKMANAYHWTLNQDEMDMYCEDLKPYTADEIWQAIKIHRSSTERTDGRMLCDFAPKPGRIIFLIRQQRDLHFRGTYEPLPDLSEEQKFEIKQAFTEFRKRLEKKKLIKAIEAEVMTPEQEQLRRSELAEQARKVGQ